MVHNKARRPRTDKRIREKDVPRSKGCIFLDTPKECQYAGLDCSKGFKLTCLLNHIHLQVAEESEAELLQLLKGDIHSPRRVKELSGQAGHKTG